MASHTSMMNKFIWTCLALQVNSNNNQPSIIIIGQILCKHKSFSNKKPLLYILAHLWRFLFTIGKIRRFSKCKTHPEPNSRKRTG